ncbi:MAG: hypothetical protein GY772_15980, partial [bacterium]|nr:hypothetical protein [bacterium]
MLAKAVTTPHLSFAALARETDTKSDFGLRLLPLFAARLLESEHRQPQNPRAAAKEHVSGETFTPLLLVWCRMFDETPGKARVHTITETGEVEEWTSNAKVMASRLRFAFLLRRQVVAGASGVAAPVALAGVPAAAADPEAFVHHHYDIVTGSMPSPLQVVARQTAGVLTAAIAKEMWLQPSDQREVEQLFAHQACL